MNVLLTGATGFIGSHVARELLQQGHHVHALLRPGSDRRRIEDIEDALHLIEMDILQSAFTDLPAAIDCCMHLAWNVEPGRYANAPHNTAYLAASLKLARQLNDAGCRRFVGVGTCFEYNLDTATPRIAETHSTGPRTLYGEAKLELFRALQELNMETAWTRLFYQYGPHEDTRRFVPYVINSLLCGEPAELTAGAQVRDFLHVEDVADAIVAVAKSNLIGAVNIGSGEPITVADLAGKIAEVIGRPDLLQLGARPYPPGDPMHVVADNTRLRTTGWRPCFDLDAGLRQTIDWWKHATA